MRKSTGYPKGVAGGDWAYTGNHGFFPGFLFMYGQMEDKDCPYPDTGGKALAFPSSGVSLRRPGQ